MITADFCGTKISFSLLLSRSWALTSVPKTRDLPDQTKVLLYQSNLNQTEQNQTIAWKPKLITYSLFYIEMKLESTPGDMSGWREVDFVLNCTYIVPDQVSDPSFSLPKAMTSIPRNLTFEYSTDNEVRAFQLLQIVYTWRYWTAYS